MSTIRRIGVMTSGGDSPGMNAAVRAVVRTGYHYGLEVFGIRHAYLGLVNGDFQRLDTKDVGGIIQQGGTILHSARLVGFREEEKQREAVRRLAEHDIDAVVVIGGDGSLQGAYALQKRGVKVIGIPGSIDNDIWGTASCIGVDTALNTILDAVDRLRDTASAHERVFIVEVMGRACGHLAIVAGLCTGAEIVLTPGKDTTLEELGKAVEEAYMKGKSHAMVIVAEGANLKATQIAEHLDEHHIGFEPRVTILGHVVRGGRPTAFDRLLATRFGVEAVQALVEGKSGVMMALEGTSIVSRELEEVVGKQRPVNPHYEELLGILTR